MAVVVDGVVLLTGLTLSSGGGGIGETSLLGRCRRVGSGDVGGPFDVKCVRVSIAGRSRRGGRDPAL
jgi:hypothetical protein